MRTQCFLPSLLTLLISCGPAAPPAESASTTTPSAPPPEPPKAAEPEPAEEPAPVEEPKVAEPSPAPAEPEPEPTAPKLSSSPRAIITASEVAFILDYRRSAPYEAAEEKCDAEAAGDPAKRAACMTKARDEFTADVLRFKKDDRGKWQWLTYKRKGSALTEVHSTGFDFGEETDHTIVLTPKGGQGERPLFRGSSKVLITVPNDYSIELDDPKLGKLYYDAKVGLVGR